MGGNISAFPLEERTIRVLQNRFSLSSHGFFGKKPAAMSKRAFFLLFCLIFSAAGILIKKENLACRIRRVGAICYSTCTERIAVCLVRC
jgi:hypothetical protein